MNARRTLAPLTVLALMLGGCAADRVTGTTASAEAFTPVRVCLDCCGKSGPVDPSRRPLLVLDGVPRPDLWNSPVPPPLAIRPENVESIEILKGPLAVARFGPSGRNGAVLVTTRSAPTGAARIP